MITSKLFCFFFFTRYGMRPFSSFWKEGNNWEHFQQLRTIFFLEMFCTKNIKENWSLLWKIEKDQGVIWELCRWCLWGQKSSGWESVKFPLGCMESGPLAFGTWTGLSRYGERWFCSALARSRSHMLHSYCWIGQVLYNY